MCSRSVGKAKNMKMPNVPKQMEKVKTETIPSMTYHKSGRLSPDTCARRKMRGHQPKDCTQPNTRTKEEKAAAAQQCKTKQSPPKRVNNVVKAHQANKGRKILLPPHVHGVKTIAFWDTGSAAAYMNKRVATSYNPEVTSDSDRALGDPWKNQSALSAPDNPIYPLTTPL